MVRRHSGRWISDRSSEPRTAQRRGWSALLAVLLLVTGAGLGAPGGLAHAFRGTAQAGSGAADGRDPALVRAGTRPAILVQRSSDPSSLTTPAEPALAPAPLPVLTDLADPARATAVPVARRVAAATSAYDARGPPLASA